MRGGIARRARLRRRTARRPIPAQAILNLFWDPINSGQIAGNYKNLVAAIKARGAQAGKIPRIIFTTYHQPLPGPSQSIECLDLGDLSRDEIDYLITLENTLKATLIAAVSGLDGVSVADISGVVAGARILHQRPLDLWHQRAAVERREPRAIPSDTAGAGRHRGGAEAELSAALGRQFAVANLYLLFVRLLGQGFIRLR